MQFADLAGPDRVVDGFVAGIEATHEAELDRQFRRPRIVSAQRFTRARLRSIGFSQSTGFPAATACSRRSAWVSVAVAISTASTSGDAKISAALAHHGRAGRRRGLLGRRGVDVLHRRQASAGCAAILAACMAPMRPQPSTAIRIIGFPPSCVFAILVAFRRDCQYTMRTNMLRAFRRGRRPT